MQTQVLLANNRPGAEDWMAFQQAYAHAYSGQLREATRLSQWAATLAARKSQGAAGALYQIPLALWNAFFGNRHQAIRDAQSALAFSRERYVEYGAAFALAVAGDCDRSARLARDLERRFGDDTAVKFSFLPAIRAQIELDRGKTQEAIRLLEVAYPYELGAPRVSLHAGFGALYPVYVRGQAYLAAKKGVEAAQEFQKIIARPGIVLSDPIGAIAQLQLARAFAVATQPARSKAAYEKFLALWKNADPGTPILDEAKAEIQRFP